MSHFIYKAKKSTGEQYTAEKDAADRYEIYHMLKESGDEIVSLEEKKSSKGLHMEISLGPLFKRVKMMDKITFARNLGAMLEAGLALSRALTVIEKQSKSKVFKGVLTSIIAEIDKGNSFSDALRMHKKVFPDLFISMVNAGEQSGTLAQSLKSVASQMDSSYTLERKIRGAMMYPAVIVCVMIVIGVLMLIFVIPTLMKTFTEMNVALPAPTLFVLAISNLMRDHGLIVLAVVVMLGFLFSWVSKKPQGKKVIHRLLLKIPIIGGLVQEVNTARTARTLSSLLTSGVDVVESINITASVVQNVYFRKILENAKEAIKKGDLMSKVFDGEARKFYPVFFVEMISVGEETGKLGEMLSGVAKYYEDDVDQKTKDMSTIIEPFLMVLIGGAVGFFAISMISPMYSLVNVI